MSRIPDRKTLQGLKRADLQKLCKDHGLKANLKSDALVELLIETSKPLRRPPTTIPRRAPSIRVISKSSAGSRPRDRSGGTVIIHDTDDEGETSGNAGNKASTSQVRPPTRTDPTPHALPNRTTRKAKETQYRLGVGRPTVAGGSGARTITRSTIASKAKKVRPSITSKPSEAAIPEEEVPSEIPKAGPSGVPHDGPSHVPTPTPPAPPPTTQTQPMPGFQDLKSMLAELVNPLREQVQALQTELHSVSGRLAHVNSLESKVVELTNEIATLRSQNTHSDNQVTDLQIHYTTDDGPNRLESNNGTLHRGSSAAPVDARTSGHPGLTTSTLGKRHRDTRDREGQSVTRNGGRSNQASRPLAKRPKLQKNAEAGPSTRTLEENVILDDDDDIVEPVHIAPGPAFTIYSGPEEPPEPEPFDPAPPTTRLSDLFPIATPGPSSTGVTTSTANAHENQIPTTGGVNSAFNFIFPTSDFQPVTSTPAGGPLEMGIPSFPFPEPPTSPTPGSGNGPAGGFIDRGGRRERNDLFRPQAGPSRPPSRPSRPRSSASNRGRSDSTHSHSRPTGLIMPHSSQSSEPPCISPAALMRTALPTVPETDPERTPAQPRRDHAPILGMSIGVGMVGLPYTMGMGMIPDTPGGPPLKRTMYGTELDADTRFGDFGVEGVAMGFWTGAAPRI